MTLSPNEIASRILDVVNWSDFDGYGPLAEIDSAEFEVRTPDVVGSRIRVRNTDGSRHLQTITEWQPTSRIALQLCESPPLL